MLVAVVTRVAWFFNYLLKLNGIHNFDKYIYQLLTKNGLTFDFVTQVLMLQGFPRLAL